MQKHKFAFTLAEVLITLGIIGIVAALTLPSLIANHQKQATVVRLKQTYSILTQALKRAELDYGPVSYWETGDSNTFWERYLKPYVKEVKHYTPSEFPQDFVITCNSKPIRDCNGYGSFNGAHKFILANGALIAPQPLSVEGTNTTTVIVDINGLKGPNKYARDVFMFNIDTKLGLVPYGTGLIAGKDGYLELSRTDLMNSEFRSCIRDGVYCAAIIMMDGWQIASDYPW